jgi:hypothetical protein
LPQRRRAHVGEFVPKPFERGQRGALRGIALPVAGRYAGVTALFR